MQRTARGPAGTQKVFRQIRFTQSEDAKRLLLETEGVCQRLHLPAALAGHSRWEVFNLANSVQFAAPDSTLADSGVGAITSPAGDPRVMQFALRLSF